MIRSLIVDGRLLLKRKMNIDSNAGIWLSHRNVWTHLRKVCVHSYDIYILYVAVSGDQVIRYYMYLHVCTISAMSHIVVCL